MKLPTAKPLRTADLCQNSTFNRTDTLSWKNTIKIPHKRIEKEPLKALFLNGAGDEARTRDILLGKEAFYHWITPAYSGYFSILHAQK